MPVIVAEEEVEAAAAALRLLVQAVVVREARPPAPARRPVGECSR